MACRTYYNLKYTQLIRDQDSNNDFRMLLATWHVRCQLQMRSTDNIPAQEPNTKFLAWPLEQEAPTERNRRPSECEECSGNWLRRVIHRARSANLAFRLVSAPRNAAFRRRATWHWMGSRHRPIGSWQRIRRTAAGGMQAVIDLSCVIDGLNGIDRNIERETLCRCRARRPRHETSIFPKSTIL